MSTALLDRSFGRSAFNHVSVRRDNTDMAAITKADVTKILDSLAVIRENSAVMANNIAHLTEQVRGLSDKVTVIEQQKASHDELNVAVQQLNEKIERKISPESFNELKSACDACNGEGRLTAIEAKLQSLSNWRVQVSSWVAIAIVLMMVGWEVVKEFHLLRPPTAVSMPVPGREGK